MFIFDSFPDIEEVVNDCDVKYGLERNIDTWVQYRGMPEACRDAFFKGAVGGYLTPVERGGGSYSLIERAACMEILTRRAGAVLPFFSEVTDYALLSGVDGNLYDESKLPMKGARPLFSEAFTEPSFFDGAEQLTTRVTRDKNGTLRLNGHKTFVPNGEFEKSVLVLASDAECGSEDNDVSLWVVPVGASGVFTAPISTVGQSLLAPADVMFRDVELDESWHIRTRRPLSLSLRRQYELRCLFMAAIDAGLARAAFDDARVFLNEVFAKYAENDRVASMKDQLFELEVRVQAIELFVCNAAEVLDAEGGKNAYSTCKTLMHFVPKTSLEVCEGAMSMLGLRGYSDDLRIGRILGDCRGNYLRQSGEKIMLSVLFKMFS